ncbi:MAG: TolC family protein [Planctomycetota bacterium]|jgi:outer membrane protein TolC
MSVCFEHFVIGLLERTKREHRVAALTAPMLVLVGCQSYEPNPIDLETHRENLLARSASDDTVRAFAERLRAAGNGTPDRFAFGDGLTVEEGEVVALFYNPQLRLARMQAGVALATFETAGLWEDPEFGFDGAEILSPSDAPFEFGLTVSLTIPISGRLEVEKDKAGAAYEAELRHVVEQEWATRMEVRAAWRRWSSLRLEMDLSSRLLEQLDRVDTIARELESVGELGRTESRLFEVERLTRIVGLEQLEADLRFAELELLGLMGLAPDAVLELIPLESMTAAHPDALPDQAIDGNPTLAWKLAEYRVAEESLRLEVRKQYPDLEIGGGYGEEDDERLLLGFSIPIPILNANRAGIENARARRELARAEVETTYERLAREAAQARVAIESTRRQRESVEDALVPLVDAQADDVDRLAELGEVDTLLLLETIRRQHEAKLRLIELQLDESLALIRLGAVVGPSQPEEPAPVDSPEDTTAEGGAPAGDTA